MAKLLGIAFVLVFALSIYVVLVGGFTVDYGQGFATAQNAAETTRPIFDFLTTQH